MLRPSNRRGQTITNTGGVALEGDDVHEEATSVTLDPMGPRLPLSKITVMLPAIKRRGYSRSAMLLVVLASCGILRISRSNVPPRQDRQILPRAHEEKTSNDGEGPSCVRSLLENERAILANSSLADESVSFQILLHPPSADRYITRKILNKGTYEPAMEKFIARALPLNETLKNEDLDEIWAVDIGANIGFHSMHMASRGANTISFEPAPDTAALLRCSAAELFDDAMPTGGLIEVVEAGASDVETEGKLSRHPQSPGMTTFIGSTNTSFPLVEMENSNNETSTTSAGTIPLLRAENVLAKYGVPEGRSDRLRLLKVDVEGFELRAFRGLNLTRFPFRFLTFEFFPDMIKSGGDDPADVLLLVRGAGYRCDYENGVRKTTRDELNEWIRRIRQGHVNIFCELKD